MIYVLKRLLSLSFVLLFASLLIFFVTDLLPGDAAEIQLGINAQADTLAAKRAALGLDQPAAVRYINWMRGFFVGDWGNSLTYSVPVTKLVGDRVWLSLPLALIALVLAASLGVLVGLLAAARHKRLADTGLMSLSQLGMAVPNFWFGIILVFLFAVQLRWLPSGGFSGWDQGVVQGLRSLALPAFALALPQAAILARITRSNLLETANEPYVLTARAKGLRREQALRRHALRNAMIPVVTIMGLQFSFLIAGAIVIEEVFRLPGLGRLLFQSISGRDLVVVKTLILLMVTTVVMVTFLLDVAYAAIDPRLRRGQAV